jgi:predicted RNA-binding Zn-ribbon protein involved in translation (DUF1610 family)
MPFFERFFKSRALRQESIGAGGVPVIPTTCPTCGKVDKVSLDAGKHEFLSAFKLDSETHLQVHQCPYCTSGMLLCSRNGRLVGIEPFTDDPPMDGLAALARTRAKLGL